MPDVDILITHSPPKYILDIAKKPDIHVGCSALYERVIKMKPKFHIFGHIHESGGIFKT